MRVRLPGAPRSSRFRGLLRARGREFRRPAPLRAPAARIAGRRRPRARASRWSRERDATVGNGRRRARPRGCRARRAGAVRRGAPSAISTTPASRRKPPQLAEEKRHAVGERVDGVQATRPASTSFAPVSCRISSATSSSPRPETVRRVTPSIRARSASASENSGRMSSLRSRCVASRKSRLPAPWRAREVTEQSAAKWRRPSGCRRDQEQRTLSADARQEFDHRSRGVDGARLRIVRRRGQRAGPRSGGVARSSAAGAEAALESRRVGDPHRNSSASTNGW